MGVPEPTRLPHLSWENLALREVWPAGESQGGRREEEMDQEQEKGSTRLLGTWWWQKRWPGVAKHAPLKGWGWSKK